MRYYSSESLRVLTTTFFHERVSAKNANTFLSKNEFERPSVSRSKRSSITHNLLGVLQTMTRLPTPLSAVTIIKIDWIMRVKAF
ncbi:hypothetical protein SAMN04487870_1000 [Pseudoalteromonas sp. DSM 26666]|nr:hypothetical protein SAMN04487870_1000 [Pseudoalteromonas sp. DSM 26666]